MKSAAFEYMRIKNIFEKGMPVYLLGTTSQLSRQLLQMIRKEGYSFAVLWDEKWQNEKQYKVFPVPADISKVPRGIIIVAGEERYQDKWLSFCRESGHLVYDGYDVRLFTTYCRCAETDNGEEDLLKRCKNCRAAFRSCPVRREWYETQKKGNRDKVIRHLAMKVGYICNLKCNYCCEYVPRFTSRHKKRFDLGGCLSDIEKLAETLEYISVLSFSGGDAMLNRELSVLIDRVAEKKNIGDIYILTNGTYLPHADILDVLERSKDRIRIVINNYSLNHEAEKIIPELEKRGISHNLRNNSGWYDLTDTDFRDYSVYHLKDLYENCSFDRQSGLYHVMFEGKVNMRCGVANGLLYYLEKYDECIEDYIDIRSLAARDIPSALTSLENRGYLDICNYCAGCKTTDRTIEAAALQL